MKLQKPIHPLRLQQYLEIIQKFLRKNKGIIESQYRKSTVFILKKVYYHVFVLQK